MTTLELTTPTDTEIVLTRVFDAPRPLVFDALTKPELLVRWYGPPGWQLVECEVDLRVGGRYRFLSHHQDGGVMGSSGEYREIVRPERLVYTETYDDSPEGPSIVTGVLTEAGGKTTLSTSVRYPSRDVRDAMLRTNMATGADASFDRLAALLESTRIAERHRRVAASFTGVVEAVDAAEGGWAQPSPCEGWDTRAVVDHLVGMYAFLLDLIDRSLPSDAPAVADDARATWVAARDTVQAILDDPDAAAQVHKEHRHLGQGPWNKAVGTVLTSDAVIHAWDLGRAIGLEVRIAEEDMAGWEESFASFPDEAIRTPEVFGPKVEAPAGADEQTRFLAFLGRRSW